jgi:hypothetical protein
VHRLVSLDIRSGPASNRLLLNLNLLYVRYLSRQEKSYSQYIIVRAAEGLIVSCITIRATTVAYTEVADRLLLPNNILTDYQKKTRRQ